MTLLRKFLSDMDLDSVAIRKGSPHLTFFREDLVKELHLEANQTTSGNWPSFLKNVLLRNRLCLTLKKIHQ